MSGIISWFGRYSIFRTAAAPPEEIAGLIESIEGGEIFKIENKDGTIFVNGKEWDKDTRLKTFKEIEEKIDAEVDKSKDRIKDYPDEALIELKSIFKDGAFQLLNEAAFKDSTDDFKEAKAIAKNPGVKVKITLSDLADMLGKEAGTTSGVWRLEKVMGKEPRAASLRITPDDVWF